jgi:hypothetical protein
MGSYTKEKLIAMRDILKEISRISSQISDITNDENEKTLLKLDTLHKKLKDNFVDFSDIKENSSQIKTLVKEIKDLFIANSIDNILFQDQLSENLSYIKDEMRYFVPVKKAVGKYKVHSREL